MDTFADKKVVVAGGAGLLGTNLVALLCSLGADVTATYHRKEPVFQASNLKYVKADLTDKKDCVSLCDEADYLFCCAANKFSAGLAKSDHSRRMVDCVRMAANLAEAACNSKSIHKFVFTSSASVYSGIDGKLSEDMPIVAEPDGYQANYVWMKRYCERIMQMFAAEFKEKIDISVVRPTSLYGLYDDFGFNRAYVIPSLIRKVAEKQFPIEVWGDGSARRNFVFAADVAKVMVLACQRLRGYTVVNAASQATVSNKEFVTAVFNAFGHCEANAVFDSTKRSGKVTTDLSTERCKELLGYSPDTPLENGIQETVNWYIGGGRYKS